MNREIHVRFWEGLGVRFPRATHLEYFLRSLLYLSSCESRVAMIARA